MAALMSPRTDGEALLCIDSSATSKSFIVQVLTSKCSSKMLHILTVTVRPSCLGSLHFGITPTTAWLSAQYLGNALHYSHATLSLAILLVHLIKVVGSGLLFGHCRLSVVQLKQRFYRTTLLR